MNYKSRLRTTNLIIKEKIIIEWKIVAGTKVESIKDDETIELLSRAGCKYISISPESGSKEVMQKIDKPFNYQHALKSVKKMNKENSNKRIFSLQFENRKGIYSYNKEMEKKLENIIVNKLRKYMKNTPIYNCKI